MDIESAEDEASEFDEQEEEAVDADVDEPGDFGDEGEDEDGGESPRIGFRNIPTWQDAIGVMIAKNMESRARNPGGSRGPEGAAEEDGDAGAEGRSRRPRRARPASRTVG